MALGCVEVQQAAVRGTDPRTHRPQGKPHLPQLTAPSLHLGRLICTGQVLSKLTVLSGQSMTTDTEHRMPIR